jgi:hypothetical protein
VVQRFQKRPKEFFVEEIHRLGFIGLAASTATVAIFNEV